VHGEHEPEPGFTAYVLFVQAVHCFEPVGAKVPAGQTPQVKSLVLEHCGVVGA